MFLVRGHLLYPTGRNLEIRVLRENAEHLKSKNQSLSEEAQQLTNQIEVGFLAFEAMTSFRVTNEHGVSKFGEVGTCEYTAQKEVINIHVLFETKSKPKPNPNPNPKPYSKKKKREEN